MGRTSAEFFSENYLQPNRVSDEADEDTVPAAHCADPDPAPSVCEPGGEPHTHVLLHSKITALQTQCEALRIKCDTSASLACVGVVCFAVKVLARFQHVDVQLDRCQQLETLNADMHDYMETLHRAVQNKEHQMERTALGSHTDLPGYLPGPPLCSRAPSLSYPLFSHEQAPSHTTLRADRVPELLGKRCAHQ